MLFEVAKWSFALTPSDTYILFYALNVVNGMLEWKSRGNRKVIDLWTIFCKWEVPTIYLAIKQHYLHICPRPVKIWNDKLWYIACREVPTKTRLEKPKEFETCICLRCIWGRRGLVICRHQLGHVATSNLFYAVDPWCCGHGGTKKAGKSDVQCYWPRQFHTD